MTWRRVRALALAPRAPVLLSHARARAYTHAGKHTFLPPTGRDLDSGAPYHPQVWTGAAPHVYVCMHLCVCVCVCVCERVSVVLSQAYHQLDDIPVPSCHTRHWLVLAALRAPIGVLTAWRRQVSAQHTTSRAPPVKRLLGWRVTERARGREQQRSSAH